MTPCGCPDSCPCRCRRAGACPCRRRCGCRNVAPGKTCGCVPSAGLWLTLGAVGVLAALSVGAKKGGSRSEHPYYALSRWESSDYTDMDAARTLSGIVGFDVAARYADPEVDPVFWDGEIEDRIVKRYGYPEA